MLFEFFRHSLQGSAIPHPWPIQLCGCCKQHFTARHQKPQTSRPDQPNQTHQKVLHVTANAHVSRTTIILFCFFLYYIYPIKLPLWKREREWDNNGIMEKPKVPSAAWRSEGKKNQQRCKPVELVINVLGTIFSKEGDFVHLLSTNKSRMCIKLKLTCIWTVIAGWP